MGADNHQAAMDLGEITRLLQRVNEGERTAFEPLLGLVYQELRAIAGPRMAGESSDHTLQPTALVNEAWLRLVGTASPNWVDRGHFYRAAAAVMRHILVDHARRRRADKRAIGSRGSLLDATAIAFEDRAHDLVALDEAMKRLEAIAPRQIDIIELRFFGGLSMKQIAEFLGISERTAFTEWRVARGWLLSQLETA